MGKLLKTKKEDKKEDPAPAVEVKITSPLGAFNNPIPWVSPFPRGGEEIYVRATLSQEVILNTVKYHVGQVIIPSLFAHQHTSILGPPK